MDSKSKTILGIAILLIVLAIPAIYYALDHGNGGENPTSSITTSTTTSESSSITTTTSTEVTTETNYITSSFTTTDTITTTTVVTNVVGTPLLLPAKFDSGSFVETDEMYGISIPKTTQTNSGEITMNASLVDFGIYNFHVVTISGAPAQEVFEMFSTTTPVTSAIEKILALPANMQFVDFVTTNDTIIAHFVAPWPEILGGTITGEITFATPVVAVGTYQFTVTMDGIVDVGNATIYLTGEPEKAFTTITGTVTETLTQTTTTEYMTSTIITTVVTSTITH